MRPNIATPLVRWWTRLYTLGLPLEIRERRCREIESDLWEQTHAAEGGTKPALSIVMRLIAGIPADVLWRTEAMTGRTTSMIAIGAALIGFFVATVWIPLTAEPIFLPQPPALELVTPPDLTAVPPPPPPPPPSPLRDSPARRVR